MKNNINSLLDFIEKKENLKKSHPLKYLLWEATIRCNLECLHCYRECGAYNQQYIKNELRATNIKELLFDIAKKYNPNDIFFGITGGEPFLRDDISEIGEYADSLGYSWGVITNGVFLNKELINSLKKANISSLAISLDGLEAQNDTIRNQKGLFKKIVKNIELLIESGLKDIITIKFCANKLNINNLDEFLKYIENLGLNRVNISPVFYYGRGKDKKLSLSPMELKYLLEFVKNKREEGKEGISIDDGYWGPEYEMKIRDGMFFSIAGITMATILYNGDIAGSANSYYSNLIEGNIKRDNFLEVWESKFYNYRDGKEEFFKKSCSGCEHWDLCEGDSIYNIEQLLEKGECRYKSLTKYLSQIRELE